MSRHGHQRVRLVLSMTLSNAEAISHMAYGMLYRTYTLCHGEPRIAVRPSVHQWSRAAHIAPSCARCTGECTAEERRWEGRGKTGGEGKVRRLEKRAISPSMLLSRDKAEDTEIYTRTTGIGSTGDCLQSPPASISFKNFPL